ncbi:DUF2480 family protein [Pararhodonellum marinum]|uniref:DUF2480 family protein n=1 Tax=Pararhodonellum marinum TaxID=2755358 RepID=UPI00188E17A9|nr:DUF2480 family protein [Pararhodonellum marinum]
MSEIVNRVAGSSIKTLDLEKYYDPTEKVSFDLKPYLFQELVLKEQDFRTALKSLDWTQYADKYVAVHCSVDAIVPNWAFMLVVTYLEGNCKDCIIGDLAALHQYLFHKALESLPLTDFENVPVVIKGCSKFPVPLYAYGEVVKRLKPYAKSIMYGEPCSTVPLYKKPRV